MSETAKKIINLLFLSGDPMSVKSLVNILELPEAEISSEIENIRPELAKIGLGLIYQNNDIVITTGAEYSDITKQWTEYELRSELTPAQLQALTIVAYMGPINNANVSFIRGVQSSQTLRALSTRGLITKSDTNYNISIESMKYLGINKVEDLPSYTETREKLNNKIQEALNG